MGTKHESTGPIDDEALNTIERLARTHQLVARVYVDVDGGGRRELRVDFNLNHYPEAVTKASLQIRWHTNDDYTFHYRDERATGEAWQCRWDRHPHTHNAAREHFHEPPAATDEPISDPVGMVEPYHLFARTMANVNERIQQIWDTSPP